MNAAAEGDVLAWRLRREAFAADRVVLRDRVRALRVVREALHAEGDSVCATARRLLAESAQRLRAGRA